LPVCIICREQLAVPGIPPVNDDPNDDEHPRSAVVLPCGHLFCAECADTFISTLQARQEAEGMADVWVRCLVCKQLLEMTGCDHICEGVFVGSDPLRTVPLTLPEGGRFPYMCHDCQWRAHGKLVGMFEPFFGRVAATMGGRPHGGLPASLVQALAVRSAWIQVTPYRSWMDLRPATNMLKCRCWAHARRFRWKNE
jgi:hypothetical protein